MLVLEREENHFPPFLKPISKISGITLRKTRPEAQERTTKLCSCSQTTDHDQYMGVTPIQAQDLTSGEKPFARHMHFKTVLYRTRYK